LKGQSALKFFENLAHPPGQWWEYSVTHAFMGVALIGECYLGILLFIKVQLTNAKV
jgi:hypothetical protein